MFKVEFQSRTTYHIWTTLYLLKTLDEATFYFRVCQDRGFPRFARIRLVELIGDSHIVLAMTGLGDVPTDFCNDRRAFFHGI